MRRYKTIFIAGVIFDDSVSARDVSRNTWYRHTRNRPLNENEDVRARSICDSTLFANRDSIESPLARCFVTWGATYRLPQRRRTGL